MRFSHILILSLIGFCLIVKISIVLGKTWTVDDDLEDYPKADFTSIQDAIDAANNTDRILVYSGEYVEDIMITKEIYLKSINGPVDTILRPIKSDNIHVNHANVSISGFSFFANFMLRNARGLCADSRNVTVSNCIFNEDFSYSVYMEGTSNRCYNNTFYGGLHQALLISGICNLVYDNNFYGGNSHIYISGHGNNTIINNYCESDNIAIALSESNYNLIMNNTFISKSTDHIVVVYSHYNIFTDNNINGYRPTITRSRYNLFMNNTFYINEMYVTDSVGNSFYLNNFYINTEDNPLVNNDFDFNLCPDTIWTSNKEIKYFYKNQTYTNFVGNYWNRNIGVDHDGDGIADVPYGGLVGDKYPLIGPFIEGVIQTPNSESSNGINSPTQEEEPAGEPSETESDESDTVAPEIDVTNLSELIEKVEELESENKQLREEIERLQSKQDSASGIPSFPLMAIILSLLIFTIFIHSQNK